jgi:hypothetical protein
MSCHAARPRDAAGRASIYSLQLTLATGEMKMFGRQETRLLAMLLGLLVSVSACADAQRRSQPEFLGSATVDGRVDHDRIRVGRAAGNFRAIQLRVRGGPVQLHRVVIRYERGGREEIRTQAVVPSGGQSRPIPLGGNRRVIQSVEIWHSKAHWRSRPTVSLYGIR